MDLHTKSAQIEIDKALPWTFFILDNSLTGWPDGQMYCQIFGHSQQWNLPKSNSFCPSRILLCQMQIMTSQSCKILLEFCQSHNISPYLITLHNTFEDRYVRQTKILINDHSNVVVVVVFVFVAGRHAMPSRARKLKKLNWNVLAGSKS